MATYKGERNKMGRAWIIIPVVIVAAAVIALVVSSFQEEVGLAAPGESGRAAVAAAGEAQQALTKGDSYPRFSAALVVALVAERNIAMANPADTRLDHLLLDLLDCQKAAREAWQADLDGLWDTQTYARPEYWRALHTSLKIPSDDPLTSADVRSLCTSQAAVFLKEAIKLVD